MKPWVRQCYDNIINSLMRTFRHASLHIKLEMWANAQRDGRPAEYRWRPLFNAAVWLCSNAAKTQNPLKLSGVPQTNERISAASGPKFTILWGRVGREDNAA